LAGLPAVAVGQESESRPDGEMALMSLYFSDELLVEAATRHPKPLSQIAENVTIVTAAEIKAMHAHSVAEVLERVPGLFVRFHGRSEFGSPSSISIHGSAYEHVLVLVDGIRWNYVGSDFGETNAIPVEIIDRIEVIKGAASSAWGSALGGVINIITKPTGRSTRPQGEAGLALGEHDTSHYHAELAGASDDFGYYLFAGRRKTDGIRNERFFDDTNLFGKFAYQLPGRNRIGAQVGYSTPENRYINFFRPDLGDWADFTVINNERYLYYAVELDSALTPHLNSYLQLYQGDKEQIATSGLSSTGAILDRWSDDEKQRGVNSRLAWDQGRHTVVVGAEYLYREHGAPDGSGNVNWEEIWSLFLNDTIRLDRWTITPGLRYDHLTIADDHLSPSLGVTYQWTENTLLRAAVSHGFRKPSPDLKKLSPRLESENIWTYQAGLETAAIPYLWLKVTGFYHDADDVWIFDGVEWVNNGSIRRTGLEVSARTAPVHDLSLGIDYIFLHSNPDIGKKDDQYQLNMLVEYLSPWGLRAQIFGRYVQWDRSFSPPEFNGESDDLIWDLVVSQRLALRNWLEADTFFKVHNLTNVEHFHDELLPNAPRWLEGGMIFRF
jgi:vitamin B12 transporter